ncbi:hypothetical protein [Paraburkholderia antibiotica]|uniref:Uncharacterized protein n=1 Tax=Paraburkholderia antibiotica TaxID=2728839 RepID=A0A7X9ZY78_9BURK|nr:hypothetical protein [Paraburkholderia antibiotica]NML31360.1 hypothetical protein [Paraburkholderia antibiotica]
MIVALTMHGPAHAEPRQFLPVFALLAALHALCFAATLFLPRRVNRANHA